MFSLKKFFSLKRNQDPELISCPDLNKSQKFLVLVNSNLQNLIIAQLMRQNEALLPSESTTQCS